MSKKNKDTKDLDFYDSIVENWTCNKYHFTSEKQKRLAHYLSLGMKPRPAALRAGYSERYANSHVYRLLKLNKDFCEKVSQISKNFRDTYPEFTASMLPDIAYLERRIVEKLVDDPDSLDSVKAKVIRDMKRSAGVLQDEPRAIQFIPVNVAIQVQAHIDQQQSPKVVEVVGNAIGSAANKKVEKRITLISDE